MSRDVIQRSLDEYDPTDCTECGEKLENISYYNGSGYGSFSFPYHGQCLKIVQARQSQPNVQDKE